MPNIPALDRLKSQLQTTGLQRSNMPLYQIINQLIDYLRQSVDLTTTGLASVNNTLNSSIAPITQIISGVPYFDSGEGGEDGPPGPPGRIGVDGIQGAEGNPGMPGIDGIDGIDGEPGAPGPQGFPGTQGSAGPPGIPGIDGIDGEQGADGYPGPQGLDGAIGGPGPQGTSGATSGPPYLEPEEPELPYIVPGPQGIQGNDANLITLKKRANQTINGGAGVFVDITELTFAVEPGHDYAFYFYIVFRSASVNTGWRAAVNHPGGTVDHFSHIQTVANAPTGNASFLAKHNVIVDDMTLLTTTITASVDLVFVIEGRYLCTTAGIFAARFANELAANTDIVVQKGSWGWYF
jgi:Collagen triple helix repeat (20 copies)